MSVTIHIADLCQYYACCTRSGIICCSLFMVLFLCRCGYTWRCDCSIGALMHLLAKETGSITVLLFFCQYLCGMIFVTPNLMVWDWLVSRAGPMTFFCLAFFLPSFFLPHSLFVSCCFPFLFFHSMGWYCGAVVFGLIGC